MDDLNERHLSSGLINTPPVQKGTQWCSTFTVTSVALTSLECKTDYPKWSNPGACSQNWQNFLNNLEGHEAGHARIAQKWANIDLKEEQQANVKVVACAPQKGTGLEKAGTTAISTKLGPISAKNKKHADEEGKAYDDLTTSGETQGAKMDCPCQ